MKPAAEMSIDDIRSELIKRKISAFDQAKNLLRQGPEQWSMAGYKHWSGPIESAIKMNEARLRDWEKAHPDSE